MGDGPYDRLTLGPFLPSYVQRLPRAIARIKILCEKAAPSCELEEISIG